MRSYEIKADRSGSIVATRAQLADTYFKRLKGLMGRSALEPGEALIISPCWSVHTWFMRLPIDVIYTDKERRVMKIVQAMRPWRFSIARGATEVIEVASGVTEGVGLTVGDKLSLIPQDEP